MVEHAAAELRVVLPAPLLSRLDLSTLALAPGSYIDGALQGSQSDLLFVTRLSGKPALVYVLFEHQSSGDKLMAFRLVKYVARILDQYIEDQGGPEKITLPLPAVIPVVLHHSARGWTASPTLEALFDGELTGDPDVSCYLPRLSFVLDDISHLSDDQLKARALGLFPSLTLWALRDARDAKKLAVSMRYWLSTMRALAATPNGWEALAIIFRYLCLVTKDLTPQVLHATLASEPQVQESIVTLAEIWKAEGEAKGKAEGARHVLLRLLQLKFGGIPAEARARIDAAQEEELLLWSERVLSSDSLSAVLDG